MKLENQVCNLELAKKLKEVGVKQESAFYWTRFKDTLKLYLWDIREWPNEKVHPAIASAFTTAELGEMLPDHKYTDRERGKWYCFIGGHCSVNAETEADCRAKMLVYLLENNLMKKA